MLHRFLDSKLLFVMLVTCFSLFIVTAAFPSGTLWDYKLPVTGVDASPAIGDIDGDGVLEIILAGTTGRISALDANAEVIWRLQTGQAISTPPVLTDVYNDQELEVLVMTNTGRILCLDAATGQIIWELPILKRIIWGKTAIAASDIQNDGQIDIIAADSYGNIICLNGDGSTLWTYKDADGNITAPAIADLNGDGKCEILVGTKSSPLLCISSEGKKLWSMKREGSVGSSPVVFDIDSDGVPEILVGLGKAIAAADNKGEIIWRYEMNKEIHDAVSVGDVDADGKNEIIVVDLSGKLYCLSSTGKEKWTASVGQRSRRSPAIADVDGDGIIEILIGGYDKALYVFKPDGKLKERIPLRDVMDASPTVVDLKGDGRLSVICPVFTYILALTWMNDVPANKPAVLWPEYRLNSTRTASMVQPVEKITAKLAGIDYGRFYVGSNQYVVAVDNPESKELSLFLEMSKNAGIPTKITCSSSDSSFTETLPYTLFGQEEETLRFSYTLKHKNKVIAHQEHTSCVVPFVKEIADLEKIVADISSYIPQMVEPAYIEQRVPMFLQRLANFKAKAGLAGTISAKERRKLRDDIAAVRAEAEKLPLMCEAAVKAGAVLAAYGGNPWAPFGGENEILEGRLAPATVTVGAFGREIESAAINLANYGARPLTVRVEPAEIKSKDGSASVPAKSVLKFHEVISVATKMGDMSADAIPILGQARTIIIPAWSVRQLWVNVNVSALSEGAWLAPIRFRSLDVEPLEALAEISVEVWNAKLPDEQPVTLCHWGYVHSSVLKDQPEAALDDQLAHGTNVFVAVGFAPKATFDEKGNIVGQIDFKGHDDYVRRHAPHGIILFCGYQGSLRGPEPALSPIWAKAHKKWMRAWYKHMVELGLGYKDYALYPVDEPGLREGLVDTFISYAKLARQADRNIQIYTDPVAGATLDDIKRMAPYVDIWCPHRGSFLFGDEGAERLAFIKSTGNTVWTYECEGNAKHLPPLGYYRAQSWLAWYQGVTGIGFWSYCTSRHDPWYIPIGGNDYLLIYQGDGIVASKRWEAVRDGIEDYSMLLQLRNAVDKASHTAGLSGAVREAKRVLQEDVFEISRYCGLFESKMPLGEYEFSDLRLAEDQRWEKIQATRKKIAELLMKLSAPE